MTILLYSYFPSKSPTIGYFTQLYPLTVRLLPKTEAPWRGQQLFQFRWLESEYTRQAFNQAWAMCWISKGWNWSPERSQNILKVTELDASIAFIRDLFTITLPVCSFCGHMRLTKAGCICNWVSSACFFLFNFFCAKKKKGTKKRNTLQVLHKLKLYLNFISI